TFTVGNTLPASPACGAGVCAHADTDAASISAPSGRPACWRKEPPRMEREGEWAAGSNAWATGRFANFVVIWAKVDCINETPTGWLRHEHDWLTGWMRRDTVQ